MTTNVQEQSVVAEVANFIELVINENLTLTDIAKEKIAAGLWMTADERKTLGPMRGWTDTQWTKWSNQRLFELQVQMQTLEKYPATYLASMKDD